MGRSLYPCWGTREDTNGTPNYFILFENGNEPRRLRKVAAEPMQKGDMVRLKTGGGGGYGEAKERDLERVHNDVIDGYITPEQALNDYGVVVDVPMGKAERS